MSYKRDIFQEVGDILVEMGGPGSGHRGHRGVKGQKGGSAPQGVPPGRQEFPKEKISITNRKISPGDREAVVKDTVSCLSKLPAKHTVDIKGVKYVSNKQFEEETGKAVADFWVAYYHKPTRTVYMLTRMADDEILAHEIGHHVYRDILNASGKDLWEATWRNRGGKQSREQTRRSPEESFCDTYGDHFLGLGEYGVNAERFMKGL